MPVKEQSFTIKELDSLVMTIELTLVSIVQGVALAVLAESSASVVTNLEAEYLPYVGSGLVIILLFWSRSLVHTFTVIRWPLEFSHNFLYIGATLIESILFTRVESPLAWFTTTSAYALLICWLFVVDLRMIRHCLADSRLPGVKSLLGTVEREQLLNIRVVVPGTVLFNGACALAIWRFPEIFVEHRAHVVLGSLQLVFGAAYLRYSIRFYRSLRAPIVAAQYEWNGEAQAIPAE